MKGVIDMMTFVYAFLTCGSLCLIGQVIYDNTKWTAGHITSLFVVLGAALDTFGIYDKLISIAGMGASIPITSFGHSLIHGALAKAQSDGIMGILLGMFDLTAAGITSAILFAFLIALVFRPKT